VSKNVADRDGAGFFLGASNICFELVEASIKMVQQKIFRRGIIISATITKSDNKICDSTPLRIL